MRRILRYSLGGLAIAVLLVVVVGGAWAGYLAANRPEPRAIAGWERLAGMPEPRGEVAAAIGRRSDGERFVVVGGFTGLGRTSDAVTFYEAERDIWTTGPRLPEPRHHLGAAALDGTVYVAGGAASVFDWEPRADLWALLPDAQGWAPLPPMPEGRQGHRLVALDGRLYTVGGVGGSAVLIYDADEGWSVGADIPHARDHLGAVVVDDEIWALGGRDADDLTDRVDIYDPQADAWRDGPRLPAPTSAPAVGVVDGEVFVLAGEDPATIAGAVFDVAWRLDPDTGTWQDTLPMPLPIHGAADGVIEGRLVVAGGASRQGALSLLSWTDSMWAFDPASAEFD